MLHPNRRLRHTKAPGFPFWELNFIYRKSVQNLKKKETDMVTDSTQMGVTKTGAFDDLRHWSPAGASCSSATPSTQASAAISCAQASTEKSNSCGDFSMPVRLSSSFEPVGRILTCREVRRLSKDLKKYSLLLFFELSSQALVQNSMPASKTGVHSFNSPLCQLRPL